MLLVFSSCSDYLEQDAGELNTIDKIFASEVETKNGIRACIVMILWCKKCTIAVKYHIFGVLTRLLMLWKVIFVIFLKA